MFVIKQMRLNNFEPRPIQSNKEIALCKGESTPIIHSKNTADCFDEPSLVGSSKTKMLGLAQAISTKAILHAKGVESAKLKESADTL